MRVAPGVMALLLLVGCRSPVITLVAPQLPNRAPVAQAGADMRLVAGEYARLDAGASRDPDGDELNYAWNVVAGPGGGLQDPDQPRARFRAALPGTYVVELTVRDGGNLLSSDILVIDVALESGTVF